MASKRVWVASFDVMDDQWIVKRFSEKGEFYSGPKYICGIKSDAGYAAAALNRFDAAAAMLAAAHRAIAALAANGAPNCEAVKELKDAIRLAEGK